MIGATSFPDDDQVVQSSVNCEHTNNAVMDESTTLTLPTDIDDDHDHTHSFLTDTDITNSPNKPPTNSLLVLRYETNHFVQYPTALTDKREKKFCPICLKMVNRKMRSCISKHVVSADPKMWFQFHSWWCSKKKNGSMLELLQEFNSTLLNTPSSVSNLSAAGENDRLPHVPNTRYVSRGKQCRLMDELSYRLDEPHPILSALQEKDDGMPRSLLKKRKYSMEDFRRKTCNSYKTSTNTNIATLLYYTMRFYSKKDVDWRDINLALCQLHTKIQNDISSEMKGSVITFASECIRGMNILASKEKGEDFSLCLEKLRFIKRNCEVILNSERIERKIEWSIPTFYSMYNSFDRYARIRLKEIKEALVCEGEVEVIFKENLIKELSVILCLFLQFHMGLRSEIYYKVKTSKLKEALRTDLATGLPIVPFESKNSERLYGVIQPRLLGYYQLLLAKRDEIVTVSSFFSSVTYAFAANEKRRLEVDVLNYPKLLEACPALRYPMDIRRSFVRAVEAYGQENTELLDMLRSLHSRTQGHSHNIRIKEYLPLNKSIALLAYSNTMKLIKKDYEKILKTDLLNVVMEAAADVDDNDVTTVVAAAAADADADADADSDSPEQEEDPPRKRSHLNEMEQNNNEEVLLSMRRQIDELLKEKEQRKQTAMMELECVICLNVKTHKVTFIPCLHATCADCAFSIVTVGNNIRHCPLCRKRIYDAGPDLNHRKGISEISQLHCQPEPCEKTIEDIKSRLSIHRQRNFAPIFFRRPVIETID